MKPQLAVSFPDKMNQHQFGGGCQVMMAEGGEKSHENVVDKDLAVKRKSSSHTQPTSITTCNTTIKTDRNNSVLTLAIINCMVNNMQTAIFVYLFVCFLLSKLNVCTDITRRLWLSLDLCHLRH